MIWTLSLGDILYCCIAPGSFLPSLLATLMHQCVSRVFCPSTIPSFSFLSFVSRSLTQSFSSSVYVDYSLTCCSPRLHSVHPTTKQPSLVFMKDESVWMHLGEKQTAPMKLETCELFGFNVGEWEVKEPTKTEMPFRLESDLDFVSWTADDGTKGLVHVCDALFQLFKEGIPDPGVQFHKVTGKTVIRQVREWPP